MSFLAAFLICLTAAAFEGLCAGRDPMDKLRALCQPRWSPPVWLWMLIGIGWYAICFTTLVRLLPDWPEHEAPVLLLAALMLANGGANFFQFRLERLDLAFLYLFPYWVLLAAFLWTACPLDRLTCLLFAPYGAYQLYAAAWGYRLWQLNPRPPRQSGQTCSE
jgi:tryptophan-rich sensory protein